jgi:hypothetical protein
MITLKHIIILAEAIMEVKTNSVTQVMVVMIWSGSDDLVSGHCANHQRQTNMVNIKM